MRISPTLLLATALWGSIVFMPSTPAQGSHRVLITDDTQLTNDTMKTMLDGLGYSPTALGKGLFISIKRDTWTYNMQFIISPDGTKIGMNANLGGVDKPEDVPAANWLGLLQENREVDPSTFYFDKDQKKLYLHRVLDNRGITAAIMREQVDNFCANIKDTSDYWKFTK